jgi:hypothetical protein
MQEAVEVREPPSQFLAQPQLDGAGGLVSRNEPAEDAVERIDLVSTERHEY